jgi:hypothetical protein
MKALCINNECCRESAGGGGGEEGRRDTDNVSGVTRYSQVPAAYGDSAELTMPSILTAIACFSALSLFPARGWLGVGLRVWHRTSRFIYGHFKTIPKHTEM